MFSILPSFEKLSDKVPIKSLHHQFKGERLLRESCTRSLDRWKIAFECKKIEKMEKSSLKMRQKSFRDIASRCIKKWKNNNFNSGRSCKVRQPENQRKTLECHCHCVTSNVIVSWLNNEWCHAIKYRKNLKGFEWGTVVRVVASHQKFSVRIRSSATFIWAIINFQ